MLDRYWLNRSEDWRTLFFMALATGLLVANWTSPEFRWSTFLLACLVAISISTLVHNHVHLPTYKSRGLNILHDYWLTVFYGYPVFAWVSTHVQNHHVYNNRSGDFAPSYVFSERNNLLTLLAYPPISGGIQQKVNGAYLRKLFGTHPKRARYYTSQFAVLFAWLGAAFALDPKKALLFVLVPQQVALNVVLIFNYLQHIHCDEESPWNHSRNVVGPIANFLLFNNGFHTAHHRKPRIHWADLPREHAQIADRIHPRLKESNMLWFLVRAYVVSIFLPSARTFDMRGERLAAAPTRGPSPPQATEPLAQISAAGA